MLERKPGIIVSSTMHSTTRPTLKHLQSSRKEPNHTTYEDYMLQMFVPCKQQWKALALCYPRSFLRGWRTVCPSLRPPDCPFARPTAPSPARLPACPPVCLPVPVSARPPACLFARQLSAFFVNNQNKARSARSFPSSIPAGKQPATIRRDDDDPSLLLVPVPVPVPRHSEVRARNRDTAIKRE